MENQPLTELPEAVADTITDNASGLLQLLEAGIVELPDSLQGEDLVQALPEEVTDVIAAGSSSVIQLVETGIVQLPDLIEDLPESLPEEVTDAITAGPAELLSLVNAGIEDLNLPEALPEDVVDVTNIGADRLQQIYEDATGFLDSLLNGVTDSSTSATAQSIQEDFPLSFGSTFEFPILAQGSGTYSTSSSLDISSNNGSVAFLSNNLAGAFGDSGFTAGF